MRIAFAPFLIMVAVGVGAACGRSAPAVGGLSPDVPDSVRIDVVNDNFYDADIFSEYEGDVRRRLGMVSGFSSRSFSIPYRPAQLVMVMRLIGAGEAVSNILTVGPGDILELRLLPDLHHKVVRR